jgi:hypothetical protein
MRMRIEGGWKNLWPFIRSYNPNICFCTGCKRSRMCVCVCLCTKKRENYMYMIIFNLYLPSSPYATLFFICF